jgi:N-acetylglucosamine kinase-like BadF-type ATPase
MSEPAKIMSAANIARRYFGAAVDEAVAAGYDPDTLARYMLGLAVAKYLEKRPVDDVRAELKFVAENCDPHTDYVFMRP